MREVLRDSTGRIVRIDGRSESYVQIAPRSLHIDGANVGTAVTRVELDVDEGGAEVTVHLHPRGVEWDGPAAVVVEMADELRQALVAGGWTPPADDAEPAEPYVGEDG